VRIVGVGKATRYVVNVPVWSSQRLSLNGIASMRPEVTPLSPLPIRFITFLAA
jgi:hypothetical protein